MDLQDIGWNGMGWVHLAYNMKQWRALVNMAMNVRVKNLGKFLRRWVIGSFLRRTQLYGVSYLMQIYEQANGALLLSSNSSGRTSFRG
jgi:hypothetical protein